MSTYLVAIASGALTSREIGPRSRVWCEKEMIDASAYEFAETEDYIKDSVRTSKNFKIRLLIFDQHPRDDAYADWRRTIGTVCLGSI